MDCYNCNWLTTQILLHVVPGEWSPWDAWGECDCDTGMRTQKRRCDNPPPINNGTKCPGEDEDDENCDTSHCPGKCLPDV